MWGSAATGVEGINAVREHRPILTTLDVSLPGMSGVDLARRIRAVAPAMPLLFASGYADVATFGDELAAETVLKKPYRIGEVAARIGDALSAESTQ